MKHGVRGIRAGSICSAIGIQRIAFVTLILASAFLSIGCKREVPSKGSTTSESPISAVSAKSGTTKSTADVVVQLAYGSEKKSWLSDAMKRFNAKNPHLASGEAIHVEGIAVGSGAAVEDLADGTVKAHAWVPASSMYRDVLNRAWTKHQGAIGGKKDLANEGKSIALSPIVLAMWKPMAIALGWPQKPVGWSDVLALSRNPKGWASKGHPEWGGFKFGHTHPTMSNSGTLSVLAETYASLGQTRGLTEPFLAKPKTMAYVESIEESVVHYGKSTGFFADKMLERGPGFLSAAVLYENLVVDSYQRPEFKNRDLDLVCVYPKEGTFWIDNPYYILEAPWNDTLHVLAAAQFRDFLLARDEQTVAMTQFGFRPSDPSIAIAAPLDKEHGVDPKEPQTLLEIPSVEVVDAALQLWAKVKKTVDIAFVFDRSGSMKGEPLQEAKQGALDFLKQLDGRDRVSLLMFNNTVPDLIEPVPVGQSHELLAQTVNDTFASGGTALYDAIIKAHATLNALAKRYPKRIYAIVVLTDGNDEHSKQSLADARAAITPSAESDQAVVRLFTIAYGNGADNRVLADLAEIGGGASFKGDAASIRQVYRDLAAFF